MNVRSVLFLEDVFPDGWTLRLGDEAEGLTPGVAAKREESPLLIRATQGEQDTKAVSEDHVYFLQKPPLAKKPIGSYPELLRIL